VPKSLKIAQGGLVFDIRTESRHAWTIRELVNRWRSFVTDAASADVYVSIACYDPDKTFNWSVDRLEPFTREFQKVFNRYPFSNGDCGVTSEPGKILTHLDPENEAVRHIAACFCQDGGIIFANTATGLFFFDPAEGKLYIFSRSVPPPFPFLSRLYSKPSQRKAVLMADIANGLMLALSWLLARNGGLLLHGAGVSKSGYAALFLGLSGAGKSTVASKCAPDTCFSDDGVIIKNTEGGVYIYPSIFTQAPDYRRRSLPRPEKLRKLFLLNKSDSNRLTSLDKNHLMNHILLHLIHFFRYFDNEIAERAFENTHALVEALPADRFDFRRNRTDWSDIWQVPEKRKNTNHRL